MAKKLSQSFYLDKKRQMFVLYEDNFLFADCRGFKKKKRLSFAPFSLFLCLEMDGEL